MKNDGSATPAISKPNPGTRFFQSLYWKIGLTFLAILLILSAIYIYISVFTAEMYFQEASQRLNAEIAPHIANENQCFINGKPNEEILKAVFNDIMVINPAIEVYLLDIDGKIISFYPHDNTLELEYIDLEPVTEFMKTRGNEFVMGIDPKNPKVEKVFSAAPAYENETLMGYIYVILASEEFESTMQFLFDSYILRIGLRSMSITLVAAVIITLITLGFIMSNIKQITSVVSEFKNGNFSARIKRKRNDELGVIAGTFNEMADTIVTNMEEMKTMDNLRRELVANVSHDLRTPLATIQGYLETILIKSDSLSEEEMKKYIQIIYSSAERLNKLVEELFELSKLEARETEPKPEPFSIGELAQDVHQKNLILADAKKIELTSKLPYNLPMVYADIGMIEKVLQNLIENAIKFTPGGGKILLKLEGKAERVEVSIQDNGYGIKAEDLTYVFDRYGKIKRTDQNKNQAISDGLGLGLTIVKKILEVHNIKLNVDSHEGRGTNFSFGIPVYKADILSENYMTLP
jgi:signal transduction histidine kinase